MHRCTYTQATEPLKLTCPLCLCSFPPLWGRPRLNQCALEPGSAGSEWVWKPKLKAKESPNILVRSYNLSGPLLPYL